MVLIYPEFNADEVFLWSHDNESRVSVLCSALPMVTKCLGRILRESHQGKAILAWGDPLSIENLRHRLESNGIDTYDYEPDKTLNAVIR